MWAVRALEATFLCVRPAHVILRERTCPGLLSLAQVLASEGPHPTLWGRVDSRRARRNCVQVATLDGSASCPGTAPSSQDSLPQQVTGRT